MRRRHNTACDTGNGSVRIVVGCGSAIGSIVEVEVVILGEDFGKAYCHFAAVEARGTHLGIDAGKLGAETGFAAILLVVIDIGVGANVEPVVAG